MLFDVVVLTLHTNIWTDTISRCAAAVELLLIYFLNSFIIATVCVFYTCIWFVVVVTASINMSTGKASFYSEDYCSMYVCMRKWYNICMYICIFEWNMKHMKHCYKSMENMKYCRRKQGKIHNWTQISYYSIA